SRSAVRRPSCDFRRGGPPRRIRARTARPSATDARGPSRTHASDVRIHPRDTFIIRSTSPGGVVRMRVNGLLEAAVYGEDLSELERFYVDVFGLEPIAR